MKNFALQAFGIAIACAAAPPLLAQAPSVALPGASAPAPTSASPDLRTAMRLLVTAQEAFYADHGTYTTDIAALHLLKPSNAEAPRVWFRVVQAGGRSWIGDVATPGESPRSCVAFVGELADFPSVLVTAAKKLKPIEEGEPVCD